MAKKKPEKKIIQIMIEKEPSPKIREPFKKVFRSKHSQITYINFYPSSGNKKNTNTEKWKPSTITDGTGISNNYAHPRAYNDSKVPDFFNAVCVEYNKIRDLYQMNASNGKTYFLLQSACQKQEIIPKGSAVKIHVISQSPKYRVINWDWKKVK